MGCVRCCSWPNGFATLGPCFLSIAAFVLTSISLYSCDYAETTIAGEGLGLGLVYREALDGDFWSVSSSSSGGYCTSYVWAADSSVSPLDGTFSAAQGFGFAAWIVGWVMAIAVWSVAPCVASSRTGWRIIGGLLFTIGLFQLLTLLILASSVCSTGCSLKSGGIVGVVAFLTWWAAAGICFMVPEPTTEPSAPQPATPAVQELPTVQTVPNAEMATTETTTQRVEADGTIINETVTTQPDGTFTVKSEIIPPVAAAPFKV
ncbi:hypothetical protein ACHAXT_005414 [Thalassiosira profunda]